MRQRPALLDAPSNLGLRPPAAGTVPGCYKLPGALRDNGLLRRLAAEDAGCVTPPRYDRGSWQTGDGVFNAAAMAAYTVKLANRIEALLKDDRFPVVLGGDCSILLGSALALSRRGRYGLVFVDGHDDFRHAGNSGNIGAAAGEDLALVTGRGQADLTDIEDRRPYMRDSDVVVVGIRDEETSRRELEDLGIPVWNVSRIRQAGPAATAGAALAHLERADLEGFWVHLDVDVLDPGVMPAVDSPDSDGLQHDELIALLSPLLAAPACTGFQVTVFDPDLDPDGRLARELTDTLAASLRG
ncbi:arginase family protein [Nonomuraea phyllanthi]|uniref:arginase family protein n=1 Tax=Nonomuraea phyllanthi TaxID=2219224 RepID=UPI0012935CB3|nr:arginase family protein [Nonomuraea phyllanthi]QFY05801.1 arginase family protein [Nonomuraea phyllanthi]